MLPNFDQGEDPPQERTVVSAVITSQKRKIRIEFPEHRAVTANTVAGEGKNLARNQIDSHPVKHDANESFRRPSTHEGLAPMPPSGPKRSKRAISTRQIAFTLAEGEFADQFPPASLFPSTDSAPVEIHSQHKIILEDSIDTSNIVSTNPPSTFMEDMNHDFQDTNKRQKTAKQRVNPEFLIPTFIKPTNSSLRPHTASAAPSISTQYPSLSHRLKANLVVGTVAPSASLPIAVHPNLAGGNQRSISNSDDASSIFSLRQSFQDRLRKRQTSINRRKNQKSPSKHSFTSDGTTQFFGMELEEAIQYLIQGYNEPTNTPLQKKAEFIHVTCRYYIDRRARYNFYDVVPLERPGYPKSGYVWTRDHSRYAFNSHTLPKHKIMQLSIHGLLFQDLSDEKSIYSHSSNEESSQLLPLKAFLVEREQVNFLHTGRFFGLFKELKAFQAWKSYTRRTYVTKIRKQLLLSTYFSDIELVLAITSIGNMIYRMESETELFYFHGRGIICITDFIQLQLNHIEVMKLTLKKQVEEMILRIMEQYQSYMNSSKLEQLIQEVKDHHPMRDLIEKDTLNQNNTTTSSLQGGEVDWIRLRSVQRISDNFRQKMKKILFMAQFRLEYCIACILEKFWLRLKLFTCGIKTLPATLRKPAPATNSATASTSSIKGKSKSPINVDKANEGKLGVNKVTSTSSPYIWELDRTWFNEVGHLVQNPNKVCWNEDFTQVTSIDSPTVSAMGKNAPTNVLSSGPSSGNFTTKSYRPFSDTYNPNFAVSIDEDESEDLPAKPVSREWERLGSHLCINVNLFIDQRPVIATDFIHLNHLDSIKVKVTPTKQDLMTSIHVLCGNLGHLMDYLPNLKAQQLTTPHETAISGILDATDEMQQNKPVPNDVDLGLGEYFSNQSSNYFTLLVMYPTLNSRNGYQLAVSTMKAINKAYVQAASLESYIYRLSEIVKKLWGLSPSTLVKQLERSLALPKIKEYVDHPEIVEDLKRSQQRDAGRLSSYKSANDYLQRLPTILSTIPNLKHYYGFIASFLPAIEQLRNYRIVQDYWLHLRLPNAYVVRASFLYDFIRRIEQYFDLSNSPTGNSTGNSTIAAHSSLSPALSWKLELLRKLKNFDQIKDSFDYENDICDVIYSMIQHHLQAQIQQEESQDFTLEDLKLQNMLVARSTANTKLHNNHHHRQATSSAPPAVTTDKMWKIVKDSLERMSFLLSQGRSFLLMQLQDCKQELFQSKHSLHYNIVTRQSVVTHHSIIPQLIATPQTSPKANEQDQLAITALIAKIEREKDDINSFIQENQRHVESLRRSCDELVNGQLILMEAHDIVGAANSIMISGELDSFADMDELEAIFQLRQKSWSIFTECERLRRFTAESRLTSSTSSNHANRSTTFRATTIVRGSGGPGGDVGSSGTNALTIVEICQRFVAMEHLYADMKNQFHDSSTDGEIANRILKELSDLQPKIELVACLSSRTMRPRHWLQLHHTVFNACGLDLRFSGRQSEFISVVDISHQQREGGGPGGNIALGNINRLPANELFLRGVERFIEKIRNVSADSVVEAILESTLETIDETLRLSSIQISSGWLKDSRLRSKLFVEVNEIINLIPLRVMSRYCWKALMITEATCQDMYVSSFDTRIERTKDLIFRIDKFVENYREIQYLWYYLLSFMKFTARNEIDRDSVRVYNLVTDEMKKMEMSLIQKNGNLLQAFTTSPSEHDLATTDIMKNHLTSILDDVHNSIQSLLDACPRLSLLSYNRLVELYRIWLLGPHSEISFISQCLSELFEGVGELRVTLVNVASSNSGANNSVANNTGNSNTVYFCQGFWSSVKLEFVAFLDMIDITSLSLDEFVLEFEKQLRRAMEKSCDLLILHRLNCVKALLSDNTTEAIVDNLETLFLIRINQLLAILSSEHMNSTYLLINAVSFAEDIWTCLGHPTGCLTTARPDLFIQNAEFLQHWKQSLEKFVQSCQENIRYLQQYFVEPSLLEKFNKDATKKKANGGILSGVENGAGFIPTNNPLNNKYEFPSNINQKKGKTLVSSLLLQEITFMRIAEELMACSGIESATELWAGRYQLRYQYDKQQRYRYCPIEIMVGNILIPHGFEYQEGGSIFLHTKEVEYAVSRVLSSAFSSHGTTFINTSDFSSIFKNTGEYSVTGKDVALALGRICTTLNHSSSNITNVKFFLSRLIYLDAIGCIDFTSLDHYNLQIIIQTIQAFWSAIENQSDQFIQDSLKYPMKARYIRNDLHTERRKNNLTNLRHDILLKKKANIFISFIIIGFASETEFTSVKVFDQFYRSIFDSVSIYPSRIIESLGMLLTARGFLFGMELQKSILLSITTMLQRIHQLTNGSSAPSEKASDGSFLGEKNSTGGNFPPSHKLIAILRLLFTNAEVNLIIDRAAVSLDLSSHSIYHYFSARHHKGGSKIERFKNEVICFSATLWDRIIWHANGEFPIVKEFKVYFMDSILQNLENIANVDEISQMRFKLLEENNTMEIKDSCNYLLLQTAREIGYICSNSFIQKCAFVWETILSHSIFILHGDNAVGKSSIRETVKRTISKMNQMLHVNSKIPSLLVMAQTAGVSFDQPTKYQSNGQGPEDFSDVNHYYQVVCSMNWPIILRISAKKILKALILWQRQVRLLRVVEIALAKKAAMELATYSSSSPRLSVAANAGATTTSNVIEDPSSSTKDKESIPPSLVVKDPQFPSHGALADMTTVIYHASLKMDSLFGCFDSAGKWQDGVLIRKIRYLNDVVFHRTRHLEGLGGSSSSKPSRRQSQSGNLTGSQAAPNKESGNSNLRSTVAQKSISILVMNGPLTYQIEQMLHGFFYEASSGMYSPMLQQIQTLQQESIKNRRFTLPTGEYITIPDSVKIMIETSDISHTSPTCLAVIPVRHIDFSLHDCYHRLLTAWLRSMGHWLGEFAPWLDTFDELQFLLQKTKFIEELLYFDLRHTQQNQKSSNVGSLNRDPRQFQGFEEHRSSATISLVLSKLSSFFRILEELFQQIHELAMKHAVLQTSEGDEVSSSSSEDEGKGTEVENIDTIQSEEARRRVISFDLTLKANSSAPEEDNNLGVMSLAPRYRKKLMIRCRLAIIYAALWGFGGALNNTEHKKFFENMLRESVRQYLQRPIDANGGNITGMGSSDEGIQELEITTECSLFDCILDLQNIMIRPAAEYDTSKIGSGGPNSEIIYNHGLLEKYHDQQIYCEYVSGKMRIGAKDGSGTGRADHLRFRSMNTRAVTNIMEILLTSGANILLLGEKGCGKTSLILSLLEKLQKNCPTPEDMRRQISENLINIINGIGQAEGIFRTLELLNNILLDSADIATNEKISNNFNQSWQLVGDHLLNNSSYNPRLHCRQQTVTSSVASLLGFSGASELRKWFEREFATETKHVLETSRFTYGVAFIDDLHVMTSSDDDGMTSEFMKHSLNRIDQLMKGLMDPTPAFGVARNVVSRHPKYNGIVTHPKDFNYFSNSSSSLPSPILHQELSTDIRIQLFQNDDFMLQRLGFISAMNGNIDQVYYQSSRLRSLISHYAVLSLPSFSTSELHVCLISGTLVSMSLGVGGLTDIGKNLIEVFKTEINELSKLTLQISQRFISSVDFALTTLLERKIRQTILLDISAVERFCLNLRYGANHITNPGGLLQLYVHEWKRFFVDPLPFGSQRDRIIHLFNEQLDFLDEKTWSVTRDWLQSMKDDLINSTDRVWTNALVFKSTSTKPAISLNSAPKVSSLLTTTSSLRKTLHKSSERTLENNEIPDHSLKECYMPVEFDLTGTSKSLNSGIFNPSTRTYNSLFAQDKDGDEDSSQKKFEFSSLLSKSEINSILYPSAFSLLLRIIRIISNAGKNVLLVGYPSATRKISLLLAAKVCDLEPCIFVSKEVNGVLEMPPSEVTSNSMNLKKFLKDCVLKAIGLMELPPSETSININPNGNEGINHTVDYGIIPSQKLLIIFDAAHQLTTDERRVLLELLNNRDPTPLFANAEIQGIADALRKIKKEEDYLLMNELELKCELEYDLLRRQQQANSPGGSASPQKTHILSGPVSSPTNRSRTQSMEEVLGSPPLESPGNESKNGEHGDGVRNEATNGVYVSHTTTKGDLSGYTFHWVKRRLQMIVEQHLRFALDIVITRSMELDTRLYINTTEALNQIRKAAGLTQNQTRSNAKAMHTSGTAAFGLQQMFNNASSGIAVDDKKNYTPTNEGNTGGRGKRTSVKRYSLLSDRSINSVNSNVAKITIISSVTSSSENDTSANDRSIIIGSHSLFSCPILGPILTRCFYLLWYEVEYTDTVQGICHRLMKNDQTINLRTSSFLHSFLRSGRATVELSVKSTEIGKYHYVEPTAQAQGNPTESITSQDKSGGGGGRRMSATEIAAKKFENMRHLHFKTQTTSRAIGKTYHVYNVQFDCHDDSSYLSFMYLSWIQYFGVFHSFRFPSHLLLAATSNTGNLNDPDATMKQENIDIQISYFIEEAKILLPYLLTSPLPSDALFLTMPVYVVGADTIATRCAQTVMFIFNYHIRDLLLLQLAIEKVLLRYDEAIYALENADSMDKKLLENNEELQAISRQLSKEIEMTRRDHSLSDNNFQKTCEFEKEMMLIEDIGAHRSRKEFYKKKVEELVNSLKQTIRGFAPADWQALTSYYTTKPYHKPMIEIMRAIMVIINFTPPKSKSNEKSARMDDDMVARCTVALLVKSNDLVNQLCNVNPMTLSHAQLTALRILNTLLNSQLSHYLKPEMYSPLQRYDLYFQHFSPVPLEISGSDVANTITTTTISTSAHANTSSNNPLFEALRRYLVTIDLFAVMMEFFANEKQNVVSSLTREFKEQHESNQQSRVHRKQQLKFQIELLLTRMHLLDSLLSSNRKKLETIEKSRQRKTEISQALSEARTNLRAEHTKISEVLQSIVADICVMVVVCHRCGWLPDHLRQHAADQLRQQLIQHHVKATDTPFIAGCLLDRLQIRNWTNYDENVSIPNDVPSINSMSLLFMSPFYTYIIDPDGSSSSAVKSAIPSHYQCFTVTAQKFSFAVFLTLLQNFEQEENEQATDGKTEGEGNQENYSDSDFEFDNDQSPRSAHGRGNQLRSSQDRQRKQAGSKKGKRRRKKKSDVGMCLIISDVHSGVTEDLVSLLSGHFDYDYQPHLEENNGIDEDALMDEILYDLGYHEEPSKYMYLKISSSVAAATESPQPNISEFGAPTGTGSSEDPKTVSTDEFGEGKDPTTQINNSNLPRTTSQQAGRKPGARRKDFFSLTGTTTHIPIPKKFRLILISSTPPTLDSHGNSSPLPVACLERFTYLHWAVSYSSKILVDSLPFENALEKNATGDNSFSYYLSVKCMKMLYPKFIPSLTELNSSLLYDLKKVITIDRQLLYQVCSWSPDAEQPMQPTVGQSFSLDQRQKIGLATASGSVILPLRNSVLAAGGNGSLEGIIDLAPVSLSILSDEKIVDLILQIYDHRQKLLMKIMGEKLLLRERNAYFHLFQELLFSMSSDYCKVCSTFLPNECFSPYALTIQAMKTNLIPSLMKYGMKMKIIQHETMPISPLALLKVWNSIVYVQQLFRIYRKKKIQNHLLAAYGANAGGSSNNSSISKSAMDRTSLYLSVPVNIIQQEIMSLVGNSAHHRSNGHIYDNITFAVGPSVTSSNGSTLSGRTVGLIPSLRNKAMNILQFLLLPLKSFFLRGFIRYIQLNIRPGYENMTKLMLLFTTWAQNDVLPIEEIRSYIYLFLENKGYQLQRFCHFIHIKAPISTFSPHKPALGDTLSSGDIEQQKEDLGSPKSPKSLNSPLAASKSSEPIDHEFLAALPGMKPIQQRQTAYRLHIEDIQESEHHNKAQLMTLLSPNNANKIFLFAKEWNYEDILERGYGFPDGLWLNSRSGHWVFSSSLQNSSNAFYAYHYTYRLKYFQRYLYSDRFYSDEFYTIKPKSVLRVPVKYEDKFEIEWLKVKGIKSFATLNQKALQSLGASSKVIEEIHLVRNQTMLAASGGSNRKGGSILGSRSRNDSNLRSIRKIRQSSIINADSKEKTRKGSESSNTGSKRNTLILRKTLLHANMTRNQGLINPPVTTRSSHLQKARMTTKLTSRASNLLEDITSDLSKKRKASISSVSSSTINQISQRTSMRLSQISQDLMRRQSTASSSISRKASDSSPSSLNKNAFAPAPNKTSNIGGTSSNPRPISSVGIAVSDFTDLIYDEKAFVNIYILENHPNLAPTFRGITAGMSRNINDFLDWKETLLYLQSIDMSALSDVELISLINSVQPPKCYDADQQDEDDAGENDGLWAMGYELTVVQSFVLAEALWPGSSHILMNYVFALTSSFLQKDGYIIIHPDEMTFDEDEDFEEDTMLDDDDQANSRDATRSNSYSSATSFSSTPGGASGRRTSAGRDLGKNQLQMLEEDEEEDEEEEDRNLMKESMAEGDEEEEEDDRDKEASFGELSGAALKRLPRPPKNPPPSLDSSLNAGSRGRPAMGSVISPTNLLKLSYSTISEEKEINSDKTKKSSTSSNTRSTFFRVMQQYSNTVQSLKQINTPLINAWYKLEKVVSGRIQLKGPEIVVNSTTQQNQLTSVPASSPHHIYAPVSSSIDSLSYRDFHPWEALVYELINEYYDVEKFVFMKELRDTIIGNKSTYFLIPYFHGSQSAIFSQRARDYALLANKHIPILYCHFNDHVLAEDPTPAASTSSFVEPSESEYSVMMLGAMEQRMDKKQYRLILNELIKTIKVSIQSANAKKAILEMLDLTSIFGNSLLYSILIQMPTTQVNDGNVAGITTGSSYNPLVNMGLSDITTFLYQSQSSTNPLHSPAKENGDNKEGGEGIKDNGRLINKFMKDLTSSAPKASGSSSGDYNALVEYNALFKYENDASQRKGGKKKKRASMIVNSAGGVGGGEGDGGGTGNGPNGGFGQNNKRNWRDSFPLIISSEWSDSNTSHNRHNYILPPYVLSEISYAWLPRFFAPDVIKLYRHIDHQYSHLRAAVTNSFHRSLAPVNTSDAQSRHNSINNNNNRIDTFNEYEKYIYDNLLTISMSKENPSLPESCGILFEEMESSLLTVMNSTHSIIHTRLTSDIRQKLRNMNKLEMRVTACVLTLWQLVQYLQCNLLEQYYAHIHYQLIQQQTSTNNNKMNNNFATSAFLESYLQSAITSVSWSSCLNHLNLWQLSRMMIKITDILSFPWKSILQSNHIQKLRQSILMINTPTGQLPEQYRQAVNGNKNESNQKNPHDQLEKEKEKDYNRLVQELLNKELFQEGILSLLDSFSNIHYPFYHSNVLKEKYHTNTTGQSLSCKGSKLQYFNIFQAMKPNAQEATNKQGVVGGTGGSTGGAQKGIGELNNINPNNSQNLRRVSALFAPKQAGGFLSFNPTTPLSSNNNDYSRSANNSPRKPPTGSTPAPANNLTSVNSLRVSGVSAQGGHQSLRAQKQQKKHLKKIEDNRQMYLDEIQNLKLFSLKEELPSVHEILQDQLLSFISSLSSTSNPLFANMQNAQENLQQKFYHRLHQLISHYLADVIVHNLSLQEMSQELQQKEQSKTKSGQSGKSKQKGRGTVIQLKKPSNTDSDQEDRSPIIKEGDTEDDEDYDREAERRASENIRRLSVAVEEVKDAIQTHRQYADSDTTKFNATRKGSGRGVGTNEESSSRLMNHRASNKINITSVLTNFQQKLKERAAAAALSNNNQNIPNPASSTSTSAGGSTICDIMFGSLLPEDMMKSMLKWTFDGNQMQEINRRRQSMSLILNRNAAAVSTKTADPTIPLMMLPGMVGSSGELEKQSVQAAFGPSLVDTNKINRRKILKSLVIYANMIKEGKIKHKMK